MIADIQRRLAVLHVSIRSPTPSRGCSVVAATTTLILTITLSWIAFSAGKTMSTRSDGGTEHDRPL